MNVKTLFSYCSVFLVIIGSSVVTSTVPQACVVSMPIHNTTVSAPQDECFTFSCEATYNDGDPDAIEIRHTADLIYYDFDSYQTYRFYSNKVVLDATTFKNNFKINYVPTLSWGSLTFTCQCGSSTNSATVTVANNGLGESNDVTATVNITKVDSSGTETNVTQVLNQTDSCLSNTMPAQMVVSEEYKNIVLAVNKPDGALGDLKLAGHNKATGAECDLNVSPVVAVTAAGTVSTFTVSGTVNCIGSSGEADGRVFYIRLCSTTTSYCRTIGTVRTAGLRISTTPVSTAAPVEGVVAIVVCLVACLVTGVFLFFYMKKKDFQLAVNGLGVLRMVFLVGMVLMLLIAVGVMIGAIYVLATDPGMTYSTTGVIIVLVVAILNAVGAIALGVYTWWRAHPNMKSSEKFDQDVEDGGSQKKTDKPATNGVHYTNGEVKVRNGEKRPLPDNGVKNGPNNKLPPLDQSKIRSYENGGYIGDSAERNSSADSVRTAGGISPKIEM